MSWNLINHILFPLLSLAGFYFLFGSRTYTIKDPIVKNRSFVVANRPYLLLFIFATAILACGSYMADRLLVTMVILFLGILTAQRSISFSGTAFFYILYLSWLLLSMLIISPDMGYGFRVFLKYLYPFLIMLFASQLNISKKYYLKALNIILNVALFSVFCFLVLAWIPTVNQIVGSVLFWGPAIIDFYPVPIATSLLLFSHTRKKKYLVYAVLFILPPIFSAIRTGILASSITIVLFAIIRYKLKSIPYVLFGCALLIGSVLYIPQVRDKMFRKQMSTEEIVERREELTTDDIDSNGRFAMWEWSMERFYYGKEWTGSGLGVLQKTFYSLDHPFGHIRIVHNDYVQILCDTGLIGLILYGLTLLSLVIHSIFIYFRSKQGVIKIAAFVAGVGLSGMLSTLYTDNVVNYSMMTLSFPFALYGLLLSLKRAYPDVV